MSPLLSLALIYLWNVAQSAPKVASPLPVFYLSPNIGQPEDLIDRVAIVPSSQEDSKASAIITNRVTLTTNPDSPEVQHEVSQFHTQDMHGRFIYGFNIPDQVRMESRSHDGFVRGTYSYVDPSNRIVKMQYWDDGTGFHVSGNNLPQTEFYTPEYTPEVQAAREEHFRLYEQALKMHAALENKKEVDPSFIGAPSQGRPEPDDEDPMDTIIIQDEPFSSKHVPIIDPGQDLTQYDFASPFSVVQPAQVIENERDAVIINNPLYNVRMFRRGKNIQPKPVTEEVDDIPPPEPSLQDSIIQIKLSNIPKQTIPPKEEGRSHGTSHHFEKQIPKEVMQEDDRNRGFPVFINQ